MPSSSLGKRVTRQAKAWTSRVAIPAKSTPEPPDEPLFELSAQEVAALRTASDESFIPRPLRVTAAWAWRLLLIAALVGLLWWLGGLLSEVVIPLAVALLLTAAMSPLNRFLLAKNWPAWLSSLVCILAIVLVVGGLLTLVGAQIAAQSSQLAQQAVDSAQTMLSWLGDGPLHISEDQMIEWFNQARDSLNNYQNQIAGAAAAAGTGIGKFFAGLAMALFATFFFLKDGKKFSAAMMKSLSFAPQATITPALHAGWRSLVSYVKAAVIVAAVDGVGAGIGAFFLGSHLWLAIMALTFVCAFVPLIGAFASGAVAVAVTLVTLGFWKAVIMLIVFIAVMQLESHLLQPLLLGRAVKIHPLVVLVGIAIGMTLSGVVGGVFAIPIVAFFTGIVRSSQDEAHQIEGVDAEPDDDDDHQSATEADEPTDAQREQGHDQLPRETVVSGSEPDPVVRTGEYQE